MNNKFYDLYHAVIKNRDGKEIVDAQYENQNFNFNDILPNHYNGRKKDNEMLR